MPTIEFRIDVFGTDGIPHSFIKVDNGAGDVHIYGFGPKKEGSLWGPGTISDKRHEYQYSSRPIEVTPEQYNKMVEYITESINNPPYYNLPASILDNGVNQCSQWINAIAKAGGIDWAGFTWNPYGHAMYIGMRKVFGACRSIFTTAATKIASPVILDLDGDGVETTSIADGGAYFDHDGNGFAEQTGWAGADDGLLVMDRDGNGTIDTGKELFGDQTILNNGQRASNGFQALADLDSNTDGKIDINDTAYSQLKIWQDADGDGYTSEGELKTLSDAGIASINTGYTNSTTVDSNGNAHKQVGTFTRADGTVASATDVWFKMDKAYTIANEWLDVPADIAALPDLQGYGNVYDLQQAMVRDARRAA